MNWLHLLIQLASIVPEAVEEIKAVATKAQTSKVGAAQLATTAAADIASAFLSSQNAAVAKATAGAVSSEIGAVATAAGVNVPVVPEPGLSATVPA